MASEITTSSVAVSSPSTIEEDSYLTLRFAGPVPIAEDCQVVITIPADFAVATSGFGFQSRSGLFTRGSYDSVSGQVVTINGCPTGESY